MKRTPSSKLAINFLTDGKKNNCINSFEAQMSHNKLKPF